MRIIGRRGWAGVLSRAIGLGTAALGMPAGSSPAAAAGPRVLLVGSFDGVQGQYSSVQAAVDAARPGDWILIGPGDYHETADESPTAAADSVAHGNGGFGGVLITTADLHLRGMNRTSVIIDGTKAGAPEACDPSPQWQNFGAAGPGGVPDGRNGIVIFKANGVSVQNLTASTSSPARPTRATRSGGTEGTDRARSGCTGIRAAT